MLEVADDVRSRWRASIFILMTMVKLVITAFARAVKATAAKATAAAAASEGCAASSLPFGVSGIVQVL